MEWKRKIVAGNESFIIDKVEAPALSKALELMFLTKGNSSQVSFMIETGFMLPRLVAVGIVQVAYERYIDQNSVSLARVDS